MNKGYNILRTFRGLLKIGIGPTKSKTQKQDEFVLFLGSISNVVLLLPSQSLLQGNGSKVVARNTMAFALVQHFFGKRLQLFRFFRHIGR